jgi:hypothetical protein
MSTIMQVECPDCRCETTFDIDGVVFGDTRSVASCPCGASFEVAIQTFVSAAERRPAATIRFTDDDENGRITVNVEFDPAVVPEEPPTPAQNYALRLLQRLQEAPAASDETALAILEDISEEWTVRSGNLVRIGELLERAYQAGRKRPRGRRWNPARAAFDEGELRPPPIPHDSEQEAELREICEGVEREVEREGGEP